MGHVEDFIIDDETWTIRYLVIDTQNWWPSKKVLVSPQWIEQINWSESTVLINLSREAIRQSPEYTEVESLLDRGYESRLHRHYDRQVYWNDDSAAKEHTR
ncbi:MAG: PRC-barrel domain-containing protein [Candidatus Angelobacter sp.]